MTSFAITPIERRCLALLAEGKPVADIAERLGCRSRCVRRHLRDARDKMSAPTAIDAAIIAMRCGMLINWRKAD